MALLVHVHSFQDPDKVGPALFPVSGGGLGVCARFLPSGLASRREGGERAEWVSFEPWTRRRRYLLAFAVTVGVNVFYILAVDRLGFILTGVVYLGAMLVVFGVSRRWIVPLAIVMTLGIHYAFYKLLKVPLPWGIMRGIAW